MYFYQPSQGHGLPHDPLNAIIGPRPIGWIASRDSDGRHNLAPYSFFNCFNYHPPIIGFASSGWKDSVQNIIDTGEFVWNLTTLELASAMNETSASLPHGEDEFFAAGLSKADSRIVSVPRVAQSPVNFECRLSQSLQLTTADGSPVETGWCWEKWWVSILMKRYWKAASTRRRKQNRYCVRAGQRRIIRSVKHTALI